MFNYNKKPMTDAEKKAKLAALKEANSLANDHIKGSLAKTKEVKDPEYLKKHTKEMSDESGIDFKDDYDHITDPEHDGDVIGRHVSNEDIDCPEESVYDIDAQIEKLMAQKAKFKKGY